MTADTAHRCETCGATFFYAPSSHRCPGEWERIAPPLPTHPYAGMTWAEECRARCMASRADHAG